MSRNVRRRPKQNESGPPLSPLPPPTASLQGVARFALPILLCLYLLFAGLHVAYVPTGATGYQDAPDEAAHVAYVRSVAMGHLPTQHSMQNDPQGYEWHQPPLYYALGAKLLAFGPRTVRLLSIVCGFFGILLIYAIARLLFPDAPLVAIVAAGIAALTPSHIAITSAVNNDALLEVCFSATLLLLLQSLRNGFNGWRAVWIGAALGAACLTKATGILLIPVVLFAFVLFWRSGEKPGSIGQGAVWCFMTMLAICGWWYGRNAVLYGEVLPIQAFNRAFAGTVQAQDVMAGRIGLQVDGWSGYLALVGQWTFQSFWAVYGTPRTAAIGVPLFLPETIYLLSAIVTLCMAGGLTRLHFRRNTEFNEMQRFGIWLLFAVLGLVALSFFGFILHYFQAQGRYLYPAMAPICVLGALGWLAIFPPRYKGLAGSLLLVLLGGLSIVFLGAIAPK